MTLTPEQVTSLRTSAGLSAIPPAPSNSGANNILAQRKQALGLDTPATPPSESIFSKYAGAVDKVATDTFTPIKEAGENVSKDAQAYKANPSLGNLFLGAGLDVAGDVAKGVVGAISAPIADAIKAVSGDPEGKGGIKALTDPVKQKAMSDFWDSFSKSHPEAAKKIEDAGNILNFALLGTGDSAGAKSVASDAVDTGADALKSGLAKVDQGAGAVIDKAGEVGDKVKNTVGNKLRGTPAEAQAKELNDLVDATSGVADKKARISALENTGAVDKNGNPLSGTKQTLTGGIETTADARALERAKSVRGIVKPGASPVDNLTRLNGEISRISEQEVTPALEKAGATTPISPTTPGWSPIVQRLADIEKPDLIKADSTLDKTYELVRGRMVEQIQKQPPTVKGLWDARKAFDQVVQDQFGDAAFDSEKNTAIKRAVSDMRREVNNIIGERVPEFKSQMSTLSNLYDARYNIAEQFQNLVDKGGLKAFKTLNPKTYAALKWGGGLVVGGVIDKTLKATTGVGF